MTHFPILFVLDFHVHVFVIFVVVVAVIITELQQKWESIIARESTENGKHAAATIITFLCR